jgi:large subunit ribosomal protein L9
MKLIFIKDVGGVAQTGAVKDISDGYALNYLIPRGLAVQATAEALAKHQEKVKREGEAHEKEHAELAALVQSLEGKRVEIKARATDKGGLFKSITAADIVKALGVQLPAEAIALEKPIKEVGEHALNIKAAGVSVGITVAVTAA